MRKKSSERFKIKFNKESGEELNEEYREEYGDEYSEEHGDEYSDGLDDEYRDGHGDEYSDGHGHDGEYRDEYGDEYDEDDDGEYQEERASQLPGVAQIENELNRVVGRSRLRQLLKNTVYTLVVASAAAVLVAVLFLPILRIYGTSMTPTLKEGQIVISMKGSKIERGDIVGVYYGSKLLIKRCIAYETQWVDIDEDGNVYVDGELLDEPYVTEKAFGECDLKLPYQVPDNCIFVMGDHRETSIDSRSTSVGCISEENVVGRIVYRIWPLSVFGAVGNEESVE